MRVGSHDVGCVERTVRTTDGVQLAVRDWWSGGQVDHTVVLLHGFCLSQSCWDMQIGRLVRRRGETIRVISYDHRGHGRSDSAPMCTYRVERLGADLAELLAALEIAGPLTIAGHSMGAMAALAYCGRAAHDRPVDPDALVLVATAARNLAQRGLGRLLSTPRLGALVDLVALLRPAGLDATARALAGPMCSALMTCAGYGRSERTTLAELMSAALQTTPLTTAVGFLPGLKSYDQFHTLGSITAATTVVSGGADVVTPTAHARELVAGIPRAVHVEVPAGGHMLLHETPHVVTNAINRAITMRPNESATAARAARRAS